jgi:hypothetical protein
MTEFEKKLATAYLIFAFLLAIGILILGLTLL